METLKNKICVCVCASLLLNKIGRKSSTNETNECCFINNLIFGTLYTCTRTVTDVE